VGAVRVAKVKWYDVVGIGIGLMLAIALLGLIAGFATLYPYLLVIVRGEAVQGYTLTPDQALLAVKDRISTPWTGLLLACGVSGLLLALTQSHFFSKKTVAANSNGLPASSTGAGIVHEGATPMTEYPYLFPLLLTLLGLLLTLAPEFVYLKDVFLTRMNTIFKFYFQAWVLWSLAGAWQLATWIQLPGLLTKHRGQGVLALLSVLGIAMGLVYTVLAVPARSSEQGTPWTLDGAAWVAQRNPGDYNAIQWLNENVKNPAVIVEAPGDNHRAYVYDGRFSALTGLPTLLGWGGHQLQWRGNYDIPAQREVDIQTLYMTTDATLTRAILAQYKVEYIVVGSLERQRYSLEGLEKFTAMFPAVYDRDGVTIYYVSP
jgi:hypothetical protein